MPFFEFNATEVTPSTGFEPIPKGKYNAVIVESDEKATRSGTGSYIEFAYEIIDGEYKGRKLWSRHNIINQNQKAVEIARKEMSAICHAVGILQIKYTEELHNKPLIINVSTTRNETGEITNEIRGFEAIDGVASQAACPAPAPGNASDGPAPWRR
jgi:hypothetical protein